MADTANQPTPSDTNLSNEPVAETPAPVEVEVPSVLPPEPSAEPEPSADLTDTIADDNPTPVAASTPPAPIAPSTPNPTPQPTAPPAPVAPPEPAMNSVSTAPPAKKSWHHSKLLAIPAAIIVLAIAYLLYHDLYYLNASVVYRQSLGNTGKAYNSLVDYLDTVSAAGYKGSIGSGSYSFKSGTVSTDGALNFKSDGHNSDSTVDVGVGITRVNLELRTIKSASVNPDIYLKASGVKGLGAAFGPSFGKVVDGLNNKWIAVDHTLFDNIEKSAGSNLKTKTMPSEKDVIDELKAAGTVNQKYVFTTDPGTAITKVVKNYGREKSHGRTLQHYKVMFVKANVKKYIAAQKTALQNSQLGAWIQQQTGNADYLKSFDDLQKSADAIKSTDTVDVYADVNTRLIYKVRISDPKNPTTNYADIGVNYLGGDSIPLFVRDVSQGAGSSSDFNVTVTLNKQSSQIKVDVTATGSGTAVGTFTAHMTFQPSNAVVHVAKPAKSESLAQVLDSLGLGQYYNALQKQVGAKVGTSVVSL